MFEPTFCVIIKFHEILCSKPCDFISKGAASRFFEFLVRLWFEIYTCPVSFTKCCYRRRSLAARLFWRCYLYFLLFLFKGLVLNSMFFFERREPRIGRGEDEFAEKSIMVRCLAFPVPCFKFLVLIFVLILSLQHCLQMEFHQRIPMGMSPGSNMTRR